MKNTLTALLLAALLFCSRLLPAQAPPAGFTSTTLSSNWDEAVGLTFTSSGSQMFVWERPGRVWVVTDGQRQLVLDISDEVGAWGDQGLIGFALDPSFDTNGYIYLLYVVDRHHLLHAGTPTYNPATNDYYSATIGRLTRYTAVPAGTTYTVSAASRKILLGATKSTGIPSTSGGHVTGALAFGTDGTLLVSTGDGAHWAPDLGSFGETTYAQALADGIITPRENVGALRSQLPNCLSGKILRLDPATGAGVASNPFYNAATPNSPLSKVWAMGFRNPFRLTIKPGTGSPDPAAANPGVLYIGNVGGSYWEEVEVVSKPGQNMGWPLFEGLTPNPAFASANVANLDAPNPLYNTGGCTQQYFYFRELLKQETPSGTATFINACDPAQPIPASVLTFVHTRPLIDWGHDSGPSRTGIFSGQTATTINIGASGSPVSGPQFSGNSVSGGVFYPYSDFPAAYQNTYFFADYVAGWMRHMTVDASNKPSAVGNFIGSDVVPVSLAVSPAETGLFYVNFYPSEIRKISYINTATPPKAVSTANKTFGPGPLAVQLTGSASTDPGGSSLTYLWNFGDGSTSTTADPAHTFTPATSAPTNYRVTLTVRNSAGLSNQTALVISVNNTPPQVTITSPAVGTQYAMTGNTTYNLRATATDAEHSAGQLSYQWQTILHHGTHQHPEPVDPNPETTTTIAPYGCGSENYYYRVTLTVTDAAGLATTQEVRLNPDCATTSFTLVDADSNEDIQAVINGAVLNLATLPTRNLNIRANANRATTGSVVFAMSGAQTQNLTDSGFPYALFSDVNGIYNAWTPLVGNYSLTATPYSGAGGTGTAAQVLTANFSVIDQPPTNNYTLTLNTSGSGTVSRSPNATSYSSGTVVNLTATPAAGFVFSGWSGDATGTTNPLSVTMSANKTITATFAAVPGTGYAFYRAVNLGGPALTLDGNAWAGSTAPNYSTSGSPFESQSVPLLPATDAVRAGMIRQAVFGPNLSVTLSAVPAGTYQAYLYVWEDNSPEIYSLSLNGQVKLTNYNSGPAGTWARLGPYDVTPTAAGTVQFTSSGGWPNFSGVELWQQTSTPPVSYTLTTPVTGSGSVGRSSLGPSYPSGSLVSLTATPATGFVFSGWSGDATGTANPLSVTMSANKTITATFTAAPTTTYTLTTPVIGSGTVSKNPNAASYASGTVVSLTATPAAGFTFAGWSGEATGTANPLAVTMSADKTITATFTAVPAATFTLTTTSSGSGTVSKSPDQASYAEGAVVSVTATPAAGFTFAGWSGDATGTNNPLSV
ncbi:PQQ-dependent sugar dehydrogenase, partial [Hymenobacter sp. BT635]